MASLNDYILKTNLNNTDENQKEGNSSFDTQDMIFFRSRDEVENLKDNERIVYPSDYAIMNGACMYDKKGIINRKSTWSFLRSAFSDVSVDRVHYDGSFDYCTAYEKSAGFSPALNLDLSSIISARSASRDFKIGGKLDIYGNSQHVIEFGEYPQDKAKNSAELEKLFNNKILW